MGSPPGIECGDPVAEGILAIFIGRRLKVAVDDALRLALVTGRGARALSKSTKEFGCFVIQVLP